MGMVFSLAYYSYHFKMQQVRKLLTRNIQAIRASGDNKIIYKDVTCGEFQFGNEYFQ